MGFGKRIFLFILMNALVMGTVMLLLSIFNVQPYLTPYGLDYGSLMAFCLIWGMGGAFISLGLSRIMAKWMMGVKVIDPNVNDPYLQEFVQSVHQLSRAAGLPKMPQVGIYDSPEVNAFATGPTKSRALVAVSSGLLKRMGREERDGVLAHEVAHIANGDMVTMTLVQGVVNAFVMFLARVVAFAIMNLMRNRDDSEGMSFLAYHITVFVLEIIFMVFGMMVVAWFSRFREFRADAGGARLAGRDKMIAALRSLKRTFEIEDPHLKDKTAIQAFKISSRKSGFAQLFSTHPPLDDRIAALESATS